MQGFCIDTGICDYCYSGMARESLIILIQKKINTITPKNDEIVNGGINKGKITVSYATSTQFIKIIYVN